MTTSVQPLCTASPAATFWQYGLLAPFLAILLLAILGQYSTVSDKLLLPRLIRTGGHLVLVSVTLALIIDWRCGRRLLYTHITTREKVGADADLV